ncbi:MAG: FixH family protein [Hyphomicrobiaceae bacterium]
MTRIFSRAATPAAVACFAAFTMTSALAGAKDFEFQPVAVDVKNADGAEVAVRLVNKVTGKPVEGAVLFRTRLDMAPNAMAEMEAKHVAQPSTEPGVYRFKADFTMAGKWGLMIKAKVPGEADTIEGTVVFNAKD